MSYRRDDTDQFFACDLHMSTRTLWMGSVENAGADEDGVDFKMAERVVKGLHILDSQSDKPITILMNNPGGDEYHGLAIYDAIATCRSLVTVKVFGHAMSMGSIILQAADERVMMPNSRMMLHYGSLDLHGHAKDVQKWAEEYEKFDEWMEHLYLQRIRQVKPKFTLAALRKMITYDKILTPDETVALGLADKVQL